MTSNLMSDEVDLQGNISRFEYFHCKEISMFKNSNKKDSMNGSERRGLWYAIIVALLFAHISRTQKKRLEKKLEKNCTKMLPAILNKCWKQHPPKQLLYNHLPSILLSIQVRRARYAGYCCKSKDELQNDVLLWTPTELDEQQHIYSNQLCTDTIWRVQDLLRAMISGDGWW